LLAEDHPANQILVRKVLQKFGIGTFEIANNGLELLNRYKEATWDAILMDCHMPEMSGYDATIEIRKLEKNTGKHTPIVAMTANAMIGEREKCLRYGMDDYMSKPINIDELKDILGQWIRFEDKALTEQKKDVAPKESAPVDLSQLHTFTDGDRDSDKEFIAAFITQSDKNLKTLEENISGESKAWMEAAHMMKGGAGGIGAFELQRLCAEAQSFKGSDRERRLLFEKIRDEYSRVKNHLAAMDLV
jgi:two-component system, sensor histidine kinase and response regulator